MKVIRLNPFRWNGSHIGTLYDDCILSEDKSVVCRGMRIWDVEFNTYSTRLLVKSAKNYMAAILDEFKPHLGLNKSNCHTFRHDGRLMIGYYAYPHMRPIGEEDRVKYHDEIRLYFAFREIFGLTCSSENYIRMCQLGDVVFPASFWETGMIKENLGSAISDTVVKQYFSEVNITDSVMELLCFNREDPQSTFSYYRGILEKIILRIDRDNIQLLDIFTERLSHLLL